MQPNRYPRSHQALILTAILNLAIIPIAMPQTPPRTHTDTATINGYTQLVERSRRLPGLPALLQRLQRRRHRRPPRHHLQARLPPEPRRQRHLAQPPFRLTQRRQRLRHPRLPQSHDRVRHHGRLRRHARRHQAAPHAPHHRPRRQPHQRRAPLVRRKPQIQRQSLPRLLHLASRQARPRRPTGSIRPTTTHPSSPAPPGSTTLRQRSTTCTTSP